MPRRRRASTPANLRLLVWLLPLCCGLLAYFVVYQNARLNLGTLTPLTIPALVTPTPSQELAEVGNQHLPQTYTIESLRHNDVSLGTGWLYDNRGDVVTNAHVVAGALTIRIRERNGTAHVGEVIGSDAATDVALIRSDDGLAGQPLVLRSAPLPQAGIEVIAIASDRATGKQNLTLSQVVALHQRVQALDIPDAATGQSPAAYTDMLELSGPQIFPGNSGGPVLDGAGQVVGIITLSSTTQQRAYAIPISRVGPELAHLAAA